ncbi:helix-turn-helix transcriptional regulator [Paraburkholderia silviterrae]|uniref:Helix-turn-helix transcriptional regulator n=1 Tax=Paraburkholderia silviterrae TaxID=2528715 RepID=A0A4R5M3H0_9BURK|nr:helix-turn-helix transcriptional regulator [Paraburkholderia silviterrae]TDG19708.1 helix-turn-helix transcriptional regulator [Paraburkholderia silviterrae]
MDLSSERYEEIIHLLYEAVAEPAGWPALFTSLGEAIDANVIHMLALDKKHGSLSYSDGFNLPVEGELAYIQKYGSIDPRLALMLQKQPGDWIHCHEVFNEEFVSRDPFYQDFLIPIGRRYVSGCKLVDDENVCVIFSVLRGVGENPLGAPEIRFLDKLLAHLTRAVRMQIQNYTFSTKALVGHALVNKLRQPVMLLTTDSSVVLANEAATRLLTATSLASIAEGKLRLPAEYQAQFLDECARLEGLARGEIETPEEVSSYRSIAMTTRSRNGQAVESLYAFFTLLVPPKVSGAFGLRPLVMLLFYHPDSALPVDSELLSAAFNLTPAEIRVCRLLAEGLSPKEIAFRIGTQYETVRKQLQSIYRKTNTDRQSELMRLMLHLPLNAFV